MSNVTHTPSSDAIKTMKLYTHIDRIKAELVSRKMPLPIDPIALSKIDSMHYLGNTAIQAAVDVMGLHSNSTVLDIGSGFGGPARILATLSKCHVKALELQQDIHDLGEDLTKRCNLSDLVQHVNGDILDDAIVKQLGHESFDGIVSYLVFLHIPNKAPLLNICAELLKPNGSIFIEDFYCIAPFTNSEVSSLANDVYCKDLMSREEYIRQLQSSGLQNVQFIDMTAEWTEYVSNRLDQFISMKDRFIAVHGDDAYAGLLEFYTAVATLFNGGNLGGVRIIAQKIYKPRAASNIDLEQT